MTAIDRHVDYDLTSIGRPGFSYQPFDRLTTLTTNSITGTSMSTPTTVASAAPGMKSKKTDCCRDRQLEKVGCTDEGGRACDTVSLTHSTVQTIGRVELNNT